MPVGSAWADDFWMGLRASAFDADRSGHGRVLRERDLRRRPGLPADGRVGDSSAVDPAGPDDYFPAADFGAPRFPVDWEIVAVARRGIEDSGGESDPDGWGVRAGVQADRVSGSIIVGEDKMIILKKLME